MNYTQAAETVRSILNPLLGAVSMAELASLFDVDTIVREAFEHHAATGYRLTASRDQVTTLAINNRAPAINHTTDAPCPPWCPQAGAHPWTEEPLEHALTRTHSLEIGRYVVLEARDEALTPDGPTAFLDPPYLALMASDGYQVLSADEARELAADLATAAAALEGSQAPPESPTRPEPRWA